MFLIDATAAFADELGLLESQIFQIAEIVKEVHDSPRFGIAYFQDKPYPPYGSRETQCYQLVTKLSEDTQELRRSFVLIRPTRGGDQPEDAFQGVINTAEDDSVGWRLIGPNRTNVDAKIIVLYTDSPPHKHGDLKNFPPGTTPQPNDGHIAFSPATQCQQQDYPTSQDVYNILRMNDINLIVLTKTMIYEWRTFIQIFNRSHTFNKTAPSHYGFAETKELAKSTIIALAEVTAGTAKLRAMRAKIQSRQDAGWSSRVEFTMRRSERVAANTALLRGTAQYTTQPN